MMERFDERKQRHYIGTGIEPIQLIESFDMSFLEGNVIKYLCRYKKKNGKEDLLKALWYLERILESLK